MNVWLIIAIIHTTHRKVISINSRYANIHIGLNYRVAFISLGGVEDRGCKKAYDFVTESEESKYLHFFRFRLRPCRFKENCPHSTNCWKKKSSSRKKRKRGSTFYYLGPVFDLHKSHKWSFSKTPLSWSRFRLDRNLLKTLRDFPDRFSSKRPVIVEFLTFFSVVKHMMNFQSENLRESNSSGVT